ncbi:MAG TPA: isoprenylcysteine carboxylmethyltransferase family protein [Vicinamibacterales bacterium]|nr:isoprenylcysteine carboxylmethyltransferase family protein [Vicinamibacterales bacterium]
MTRLLARWRVFLGFVFAAIVLWLATPTSRSLIIGAAIAVIGESMRLWAAGHLEKSKEVTMSGPYRYTRHPLYLGSSLIGIGVAVIANNWIVAAIVISYLALTLTAAMRSEEAHLREKFGDAYDAYAERRGPPMLRQFSWARARGNREHHTISGLLAGVALLALKLML